MMRVLPSAFTCVALLAASSAATPAAAQPPARSQPAPQSSQPQRPRGVQNMTLDSTAWPDGGVIPAAHAQPGRDVSPPLTWSGAPEGVVSYVLVVRDLDAVSPATGEDTLHWLVWNIPGASTSLPAGVPQGNRPPTAGPGFGTVAPRTPTDGLRQISATGPAYRGPAAPANGPAHHYVFELFALDTWIDVPAEGQSPSATRGAVTAAMVGHVRGKGVRVALFRRSS